MKPLMLPALLFLAAVAPDPVPRAGVALMSDGHWVAAIEGPSLPVGTTLTLVTDGPPQQAHRATVLRSLAESPALAKHDTTGPYYELESSAAEQELFQVAIALVGRPTATRVGSALSLRLNDQYPDVRVRTCASTEGLHLTLWSGPVLKGQRLWHAYCYLGYDVEPDCQPEDYRDSE
jgi:hypothetical protein